MTNKTIIIITLFFLLLSTINSEPSPIYDTILVEFDNKVITLKDLHDRINILPASQRARYRTIEGQKIMLETMVREQTFYRRALELGMDKIYDINFNIDKKSETLLTELYLQKAYREELNFNPTSIGIYFHEISDPDIQLPRYLIQLMTDNQENDNELFDNPVDVFRIENDNLIRNETAIETETRIHFFRQSDFEIASERTFAELQQSIESAIIRQKEEDLFFAHIGTLFQKYNVELDRELLKIVGVGVYRLPGPRDPLNHPRVESITAPIEHKDSIAIASSHPDVQMTLWDVEYAFRIAASKDLLLNEFDTPRLREQVLLGELDRRLLSAAKEEDDTIGKNQDNLNLLQIKMDEILDYYDYMEIYRKIDITQDEILEFYEDNKHGVIVPEIRTVRQFVSLSSKEAKKHRKEMAKLIRKNQLDRLGDYVRQESFVPTHEGVFMVTRGRENNSVIGQDDVYIKNVFDAKKGELSNIFQNIHEEYIFFYLEEITPERIALFPEVEHRFREIVYERKAAEISTQMLNELKDQYSIVSHPDRIVGVVTAEELYFHAEHARQNNDITLSIYFLDSIINDFPDTDYAYEALFLKGFLASDVLEDKEMAKQAFTELLEKYSEDYLTDSALFLLEEIEP